MTRPQTAKALDVREGHRLKDLLNGEKTTLPLGDQWERYFLAYMCLVFVVYLPYNCKTPNGWWMVFGQTLASGTKYSIHLDLMELKGDLQMQFS